MNKLILIYFQLNIYRVCCCIFILLGISSCDLILSKQSSSKRKLANPVAKIDSVNQNKVSYALSELEDILKEKGLVDIQEIDSTIKIDIRYSTTNNFLKQDVYEDYDKCYLQTEVADKLVLAQLFLRSKYPSYNLLVFDGVRPRSVQWKMWKLLKMPIKEKARYVSNPKNGSLHNFGAAVDLTIVNEKGVELDMGTAYDYFGELAYPRKEKQMLKEKKLSKEQLANRVLLRQVMKNSGFTGITTEWWHFNSCSRNIARTQYSIVE